MCEQTSAVPPSERRAPQGSLRAPGGAGGRGRRRSGWGRDGAGQTRGGVRERDAHTSQTSGACRSRSGGRTDRDCTGRGCTGRGCRADARPGAAMVKISFQPAVAGIKGDKADKASASAAAPAPAAEILLTPARVRGAGGLRLESEARHAQPAPGTVQGVSGSRSRDRRE